MKKIIRPFANAFSTLGFGSSKSAWKHLKNTSYTPHKDKESIFLQDGELEIKYTKKAANKIVKEVLHRHIDPVIEELTYPHSQIDEQAFDYFIKKDMRNDANHISYLLSNKSNSFIKQNSRSFATLSYKDHKLEKKLSIKPELSVFTSAGDKVVTGFSLHKGTVQVNAFKDTDDMLLARVQASKHDGVSTAFLRLGDKALLTATELKMQYDLYCIEEGLYDQIILCASKLNNDVEVVSHYTGMLKTDRNGDVIFERSKDGIERPKTYYNPNKGKFVSMESHEGNTASLTHIAYKTQGHLNKYELVFIPKNHKSISQITKVCEALLSIKNTSTQDPEVLDLVLKKHGLSNNEVAVELVREINKHDTSNGIFHVNIRDFQKGNSAINQFILGADFLDKNLSYKLQILKETDLYDEPNIVAIDDLYEDPIDYKVMGSSNDPDIVD
jgi:hypothetical protein